MLGKLDLGLKFHGLSLFHCVILFDYFIISSKILNCFSLFRFFVFNFHNILEVTSVCNVSMQTVNHRIKAIYYNLYFKCSQFYCVTFLFIVSV